MLNKKGDKKGKCPFNKLKPCDDECILYRRGIRFNETKNENFPFEDCALNVIADNLEAMHNRTFMLQREVGETKGVMAMKILSDMGKVKEEDAACEALRILCPIDDKKKLEEK